MTWHPSRSAKTQLPASLKNGTKLQKGKVRFGGFHPEETQKHFRHNEQSIVDAANVDRVGDGDGIGVVEASQLSSTQIDPGQDLYDDQLVRRRAGSFADDDDGDGNKFCVGRRDVANVKPSQNFVSIPVEVQEERLGRGRRGARVEKKSERQGGSRYRKSLNRKSLDRADQESGYNVQSGKRLRRQIGSEKGGVDVEPLPDVPAEADENVELDRCHLEQVDENQQEKVAKFSPPRKFLFVI